MDWHEPWVQAQIAFLGLFAIAVLIGIVAVAKEIRRGITSIWEVTAFLLLLALSVGALAALFSLFEFANAKFAELPDYARAIVKERIDLVVFLFWLVVFGVLGLSGGYALVASFAVLGGTWKSEKRVFLPAVDLFSNEYWAVTERRAELTPLQRARVCAHHTAFGLIVLFTAGAGLLMTFGVPRHPLGIYWALAVLAAWLLNPARADRQMAARVAATQIDAQVAQS